MPYQSAIMTAYHGPTNFRGSRVKATAPQGLVTVEYQDELSSEANHCRVAMILANKLAADFAKRFGRDPIDAPWSGQWIGGDATNNGYCFVRLRSTNEPQTLNELGFISNGQKTFTRECRGEMISCTL